jgi:hypothetical protein
MFGNTIFYSGSAVKIPKLISGFSENFCQPASGKATFSPHGSEIGSQLAKMTSDERNCQTVRAIKKGSPKAPRSGSFKLN